jgi:hypothetical protein
VNVLFPVFAMLALTLGVGVRMGLARYRAVARREVDGRYYEAYQGEEPRELRVLSRHFSNLLETPPLFYVACIIAYVTDQQGLLIVGLGWAYVALRVVHTFIHLGPNIVIRRFQVFVLSLVVLTVMLVLLLIGML